MYNNSSKCIAETLCIENNFKSEQNSGTMKFNKKKSTILKKFDGGQCTGKNSSFKQACKFPISFCRRGSKDLLTWINGLTSSKKSPMEIAQKFYEHIQPSLLLILVCIAIAAISVEVCISVILLLDVIRLEPGFLFLFASFVVVGFIGLSILDKHGNPPKRKVKSKEI